ncbi:protein-L-isoaspartate(D-aspartate) O-methyltransferase [Pelomonas saccharophila]|uniref:Protein-L-isoaspartate O-methyltransferase n=1 Tax=Roseateles saccharophilus TaxID=304 RepID=A0ABU1YL27_ROSSA|nr:protein-L-isoaspartate(D-aspartate) O-methyltransferase [Roseateles saccharophilus]MDR7269557.1 protein-L-isoaspartate(D-aspartate) O-methyltransferase [Roseateles saccharophilus]
MKREAQREHMVATQLRDRGIRCAAVLDAMAYVPREAFVEPGYEDSAYDDRALPIARGQTISQPYVVALMIEAAGVGPADEVLEIGAGSGYAAAVLGRIAHHVIAVERDALLADTARQRMAAVGLANVDIVVGDGSLGWPFGPRFDAILVAAGGPAVPRALKAQLAEGGRLVMPIGAVRSQRLVRLTRRGGDHFEQQELADVHFVPLIGAQGWAEHEVAP